MKQAFYALCYLHANHICHRDIKPENFLLYKDDDDSHIKLIDFGLAKKVTPNEVMSKPNGTPYCVAKRPSNNIPTPNYEWACNNTNAKQNPRANRPYTK